MGLRQNTESELQGLCKRRQMKNLLSYSKTVPSHTHKVFELNFMFTASICEKGRFLILERKTSILFGSSIFKEMNRVIRNNHFLYLFLKVLKVLTELEMIPRQKDEVESAAIERQDVIEFVHIEEEVPIDLAHHGLHFPAVDGAELLLLCPIAFRQAKVKSKGGRAFRTSSMASRMKTAKYSCRTSSTFLKFR